MIFFSVTFSQIYLRLFKWVVSYATWRYGQDSAGQLSNAAIKSDVVDESGQGLEVVDNSISIIYPRDMALYPHQLGWERIL